jgi:hypothetical protein
LSSKHVDWKAQPNHKLFSFWHKKSRDRAAKNGRESTCVSGFQNPKDEDSCLELDMMFIYMKFLVRFFPEILIPWHVVLTAYPELSFGWHLSLSDEMLWTPLPEMVQFSSDFQLVVGLLNPEIRFLQA